MCRLSSRRLRGVCAVCRSGVGGVIRRCNAAPRGEDCLRDICGGVRVPFVFRTGSS